MIDLLAVVVTNEYRENMYQKLLVRSDTTQARSIIMIRLQPQ